MRWARIEGDGNRQDDAIIRPAAGPPIGAMQNLAGLDN